METITTPQVQTLDASPHVGKMLAEFLATQPLNITQVARKLKMSQTTLTRSIDKYTLQFKVMWDISVALNRNFIAELGEKLPVDFVTSREKELQEQLQEKQKEIEKLNMELSIYKRIMEK